MRKDEMVVLDGLREIPSVDNLANKSSLQYVLRIFLAEDIQGGEWEEGISRVYHSFAIIFIVTYGDFCVPLWRLLCSLMETFVFPKI